MKKQILSFAFVATLISVLAVGCSSSEKAATTDTVTAVDTAKVAPPDTAKLDTTKKM